MIPYDQLRYLQQITTCERCQGLITIHPANNSVLCRSCGGESNSPVHLRHDIRMSILSLTMIAKVLEALEAHLDKFHF